MDYQVESFGVKKYFQYDKNSTVDHNHSMHSVHDITSPMIVGRLAPSPTGYLHLGHARSFLLAWWHARSRGGRIVLRLEDLDIGRRRANHIGDGFDAERKLGDGLSE